MQFTNPFYLKLRLVIVRGMKNNAFSLSNEQNQYQNTTESQTIFHIKRTRCTIITNNLTVSKGSISVAWCVHDCGNIIHTTDDPSQASATLNFLSTQTLLDKHFTTVPLYLKSSVNMVKLITQRQSKLCFLLHGWITKHKQSGQLPCDPRSTGAPRAHF